MNQSYRITGMTCQGCLKSVEQRLRQLPHVGDVHIDLSSGRAVLDQRQAIPIEDLEAAFDQTKFSIEALEEATEPAPEPETPRSFWATYRPLLLIVAYLLGVSALVQFPFEDFSGSLLMRHFMAGFFLVFSFFKLLNLQGFANAYARYDLLAEQWKGWGFVYPFVELGLGILYLTHLFPFYTNVATIVILGFSSIGVIKSNLSRQKIQCACLGDVFDLPMSTVTIVEDVSMVLMAVWMLWV